jgi:amino acid adenylation domain-containing protein
MESIVEGFHLSVVQKYIWDLQRTSHSYRTVGKIRVTGNLDVQAFRKAIQSVVERYELLHTRFVSQPEMSYPLQVITDDTQIFYQYLDLRGKEQEMACERLYREEFLAPFDYERSPLLRVSLLALAANEYLLFICLPGLYGDSETLRSIVGMCASAYANAPQEEGTEVFQFVDIAQWQTEFLESEEAQVGRRFWEQQVAQYPKLTFPFSLVSKEGACLTPDACSNQIDATTLFQIKELTQKYQVSIDTFLLACWEVLLWQYTRQQDILVNMACDDRTLEELQGAPGPLTRWVPVRCQLTDDMSFLQFLRSLDDTVSIAHSLQSSFLPLLKEGNEEFFLIAPAAFFFEQKQKSIATADLIFSFESLYSCSDYFSLKLSCLQTESDLSITLEFDSTRFDGADARRMLEALLALIRHASSSPEKPLGKLNLVSEDEYQRRIVQQKQESFVALKDHCIHHLFEAQVERIPEAIAISYGPAELTYQELNKRANRLAHYLRSLGVSSGSLVGICIGRSFDLVVAILSVLKVGGGYVSLAPEYPPARLAYMLEDTRTSLMLTTTHAREVLPAHTATVICLDEITSTLEEYNENNPDYIVKPEDTAYIVYTSGSTGNPKGVVTPHRGVVNYLSSLAHLYNLNSADVVLQLAPFSFDASVRDTLGPLTAGARVVLMSDSEVRSFSSLANSLCTQAVTCILSIVPSFLRAFLNAENKEHWSGNVLRLILTSGEHLYRYDCQRVYATSGKHVQIVNQYGPTECTMTSSYYKVSSSDLEHEVIPIGKPLPDVQMYVLNEELVPVPVWVTGELYIGGIGVTKGYLNQPELTSRSFIPDVFNKVNDRYLYKTGDSARYLPDGNIELLGRSDRQVKIHGIRIELGEIEATLYQYPGVHACAVIVQDNNTHSGQLVAYIVPQLQQEPLTLEEVRAFLLQNLPLSFVPAALMTLPELPRTPNGKVDYAALPPYEAMQHAKTRKKLVPDTPIEKGVAEIFAQTLNIDTIALDDNFFELGGHSLLATQVVYKLNTTFSVMLPLRSIFDAPTVEKLAEMIVQATHHHQAQFSRVSRLLSVIEQVSSEELRHMYDNE